MISSRWLFKCHVLILVTVITWLKSRINSSFLALFKYWQIIWMRLKMPQSILSISTRILNSCGEKPFKSILLPSLTKVKILARKSTLRSIKMVSKKRMRLSSGWLIRFLQESKLKNQALIFSMTKSLTLIALSNR